MRSNRLGPPFHRAHVTKSVLGTIRKSAVGLMHWSCITSALRDIVHNLFPPCSNCPLCQLLFLYGAQDGVINIIKFLGLLYGQPRAKQGATHVRATTKIATVICSRSLAALLGGNDTKYASSLATAVGVCAEVCRTLEVVPGIFMRPGVNIPSVKPFI